jgi:hypothetical protein
MSQEMPDPLIHYRSGRLFVGYIQPTAPCPEYRPEYADAQHFHWLIVSLPVSKPFLPRYFGSVAYPKVASYQFQKTKAIKDK